MGGSRLTATAIGAGPYGLSVAAHIRHRGIQARVFGGDFCKQDGEAARDDEPIPIDRFVRAGR
jgi:hypothetical protein